MGPLYSVVVCAVQTDLSFATRGGAFSGASTSCGKCLKVGMQFTLQVLVVPLKFPLVFWACASLAGVPCIMHCTTAFSAFVGSRVGR